MCRRYASPDQVSIDAEFDLVRTEWEFAGDFNVAPAAAVPTIRVVDGRPEPALMTWGFGETPTYTLPIEALKLNGADGGLLTRGQRCIVPALGFYEWQVQTGGRKQPFYVHVEDQAVFGFAAVWERESCVILTMPANEVMASVDNSEERMPAILARGMRDVWLYGSTAHAAAALAPYPADRLVAYAVRGGVESLENHDETLVEPQETDVD